MKYRHLHGYKYETMKEVFVETACLNFKTDYVLIINNKMCIKPRYAWDGPSGPTFDTKTFMRGSLVHDVYYQLMREGHLDRKKWRKYADEELRRICLEDGMSKFRAWYVYKTIRVFGVFTCKPRENPRGRIVEI